MAKSGQDPDQHIAVFGGSGSGKTVLLSSLYGGTQEAEFLKKSLYRVVADDTGQGHRLHQNYLGMKNEAKLPPANRFKANTYSFSLRLKDQNKNSKAEPFDALRFVWHDYPGEWFEQEPSTESEAENRVEGFRKLLRSDVALMLVDGQQLLSYAGEEEKYLAALFGEFRNGLLRLKDSLLDDGEPLSRFPRIWIIALSKADLHPELDVHGFRDLMIQKAAGEIANFRDALAEMVDIPEALSFGEDYLLLSSAKFEPERIELAERVGLNLVLPIAILLPLQRLGRWMAKTDMPKRLLGQFCDNSESLVAILTKLTFATKFLQNVPKVGPILGVSLTLLQQGATLAAPEIRKINEKSRADHSNMTTVISQFGIEIEDAVAGGRFIRSEK